MTRGLVAMGVLMLVMVSRPVDAAESEPAKPMGKFANPIGFTPDPSVVFRDGYYYGVVGGDTGASGLLSVTKSPFLETVYQATSVAGTGSPLLLDLGPDYRHLWAPEIQYLHGSWYIYGCAQDATGFRRTFVLKGTGEDPTTAAWSEAIDLLSEWDPTNPWGTNLDAAVLEKSDGSLYLVFAGQLTPERYIRFPFVLYIAPLSDPMTVSGDPVPLSQPTYGWEGEINEAPAFLYRDGKIILIYSANGAFTTNYALGQLVNENGNVMDPASWTKSPVPVFTSGGGVTAPGHNSFVKSPDGTEDWIVYHAKYVHRYSTDMNAIPGVDMNQFVDSTRQTMAQRFTWTPEGLPSFGVPLGDGQLQDRPSGEKP